MIQFARVAAVIALVVYAGVLATPKGREPLPVRAIQRAIAKARGTPLQTPDEGAPVPVSRRLAAFTLVIAAFILAVV